MQAAFNELQHDRTHDHKRCNKPTHACHSAECSVELCAVFPCRSCRRMLDKHAYGTTTIVCTGIDDHPAPAAEHEARLKAESACADRVQRLAVHTEQVAEYAKQKATDLAELQSRVRPLRAWSIVCLLRRALLGGMSAVVLLQVDSAPLARKLVRRVLRITAHVCRRKSCRRRCARSRPTGPRRT